MEQRVRLRCLRQSLYSSLSLSCSLCLLPPALLQVVARLSHVSTVGNRCNDSRGLRWCLGYGYARVLSEIYPTNESILNDFTEYIEKVSN